MPVAATNTKLPDVMERTMTTQKSYVMLMLAVVAVAGLNTIAELLRWVRVSGNLWVPGVGQDFENLEDLEKIFEARPSDKPDLENGFRMGTKCSHQIADCFQMTQLLMKNNSCG